MHVYSKGAGVTPLPRGRHRLAPEEVEASQRQRLVGAMRACVAERGFAETTVQQVAARARVSPNAFYKLFADKLDGFLAVCWEDADELLATLGAAGAAETWGDAVREGMRTYLAWWPARPEASRAFLLGLPAAGGAAVEERTAIQERFVAMFTAVARRARAEQPDLTPVSDAAVRVLVAGITELVADEVRAGRIERLPGLEDELVRLTVTMLAGR